MKATIPGYKQSTGQVGFAVYAPGHYELETLKCTIRPPKNGGPEDDFVFSFKILSGPPMPSGRPSAGKKFSKTFFIKRPDHPQYMKDKDGNALDSDSNVDELKSFNIAAGVVAKGDSFDTDTYPGTKVGVDLTVYQDKKGTDRNGTFNWVAVS
jgi:hypothetical protein